jgi:hypothetical protein
METDRILAISREGMIEAARKHHLLDGIHRAARLLRIQLFRLSAVSREPLQLHIGGGRVSRNMRDRLSHDRKDHGRKIREYPVLFGKSPEKKSIRRELFQIHITVSQI